MKASDYIIKFIAEKGTDVAFVFTGGAISHVIDSFRHFSDKIKYVSVHNEQVGAMAAEAYSRTRGQMGVAMATSGPGGTNMLTGVVGAWYDCVPALFITGQVRAWELTGTAGLLQRGFQEVDIVAMAKPVTKYAKLVKNPADLRYELEKAYYLANEGRPGPVLLDLPMDVQWADIEPETLQPYQHQTEISQAANPGLAQFTDLLLQSSRPLIVAGGGIRQAGAAQTFRQYVDKVQIPVIFSYAGYDLLPFDHPCNGGVMGQFGQHGANFATHEADLIIALGTRFCTKQVGNNVEGFAPNAQVVSVNIDCGELENGRVKPDGSVHMDIRDFLTQAARLDYTANEIWRGYVRQLRDGHPVVKSEYYEESYVNPYVFIDHLSEKLADDAVIIPDVGQNVIATVQAIKLKAHQRLFSSWANSPMGYSLPAAIGVQAGSWDRQVICIIGDGGIQVNLQDLQTIANYKLPIKIFLFNNECYATIHEYQDQNLEGRYEATDRDHGYSHPRFSRVAEAFGIQYFKIRSYREFGVIEEALDHKKAVLCELLVDPGFRVSPALQGNDPLHILSPRIPIEKFKPESFAN